MQRLSISLEVCFPSLGNLTWDKKGTGQKLRAVSFCADFIAGNRLGIIWYGGESLVSRDDAAGRASVRPDCVHEAGVSDCHCGSDNGGRDFLRCCAAAVRHEGVLGIVGSLDAVGSPASEAFG